ncbi:MAG: hypothetical protein ABL985_11270, partial [Casimicrobium sp.]
MHSLKFSKLAHKILLFGGLANVLLTGLVSAATFLVSSSADHVGPDGVFPDPSGPTNTLRHAIVGQFQSPERHHEIVIAPGLPVIHLAADLPAFAVSYSVISLQGNGATVDGVGLHRALFVHDGQVSVRDLTIVNTRAAGGTGGGGGAGLGAALLVGRAASVKLDNVTFTGNVAVGGRGGAARGEGGGGMGGNGGAAG